MEKYPYFEPKDYKHLHPFYQNLYSFKDVLWDFGILIVNAIKCRFSRHIPVAFYSQDHKYLIHCNTCARCYSYTGLGRIKWHQIPTPVLPDKSPVTPEEYETFARDVEQAIKLFSKQKRQDHIVINIQNQIDRIMLDRAGFGILTNPIAIPHEYWDSYSGKMS